MTTKKHGATDERPASQHQSRPAAESEGCTHTQGLSVEAEKLQNDRPAHPRGALEEVLLPPLRVEEQHQERVHRHRDLHESSNANTMQISALFEAG